MRRRVSASQTLVDKVDSEESFNVDVKCIDIQKLWVPRYA